MMLVDTGSDKTFKAMQDDLKKPRIAKFRATLRNGSSLSAKVIVDIAIAENAMAIESKIKDFLSNPTNYNILGCKPMHVIQTYFDKNGSSCIDFGSKSLYIIIDKIDGGDKL